MPASATNNAIDAIFRAESRRVLATLIRLLGDFDLAEEALQESFASATEQWPKTGLPDNPRAWLVSTGKFKGIDALRRQARADASLQELAERIAAQDRTAVAADDDRIEDDQLRLIFTCCHPALAAESRIALTLREVCGLTTDEIARAFLVAPPTIAQRIVRAKSKIKAAGIPYQVPSRRDMPERLETVLYVIYLVFTEGYAASSGDSLTRADLSTEAIRLGRLLLELLPEGEVIGLLALMLLQESRRGARMSPTGELILLEDQDRSLWNRDQITEGLALARQAVTTLPLRPYAIQAAIAAVHAEAASAAQTNWGQIADLYDALLAVEPSPVVELNRAVAIAMRDGPAAGLALVDAIIQRGDLANYHLAHAARAEYCRQLGQIDAARQAFEQAITLAGQDPERRFLQRKLDSLPNR